MWLCQFPLAIGIFIFFFFFAFFTFGFSLFRFVYFLIAREMEGEEFGFFFFGDIYFRVEPRVLRKSREGDLCVTFRIISDRFGNISVNGERCCGLLVYGIAEEVRRVRFCRGFRMQMMFDRPSSLRLITFSNGGNVFFGDLVALGVCFLLFWIDTYTFPSSLWVNDHSSFFLIIPTNFSSSRRIFRSKFEISFNNRFFQSFSTIYFIFEGRNSTREEIRRKKLDKYEHDRSF